MSRRRTLWRKKATSDTFDKMIPSKNVHGLGKFGTGLETKSKGAGKGGGKICTKPMKSETQDKIRRWLTQGPHRKLR